MGMIVMNAHAGTCRPPNEEKGNEEGSKNEENLGISGTLLKEATLAKVGYQALATRSTLILTLDDHIVDSRDDEGQRACVCGIGVVLRRLVAALWNTCSYSRRKWTWRGFG